MKRIFLLFGVILAAQAEVVDSAANGFTVRTTISLKAPPDAVYKKFVENIGEWWNSAHTFSGDAHNLRIEAKPGGCLCEKLPNEGFVRHLEIVYVRPGKNIVLHGAMGPMQPLAMTGSLSINLMAENDGTKLVATYALAGYLPKGANTFAAPVDMMLAEQFTRLQRYVETGSAAAPK